MSEGPANTPPGWPTPERVAEIIAAIKKRIADYAAEFVVRGL